MTTTCRRTLVSLAALAVTLGLGACARASFRAAPDGLSALNARPLEIRFDNDSREYVHVYLVGDNRQWLLGRVEPGARRMLRIPEEVVGEDYRPVRLVALTGERVTLQPGRHPKAARSVPLSAAAVMSRRWWFAQGDLMSLGR